MPDEAADGRASNGRPLQYTDQHLINGLHAINDEHGRVTRELVREYAPFSSGVLVQRFGSFNEAKEEAGLETYSHGGGIWRTENGITAEDYYEHLLEIAGCVVCGEEAPACIEFHHVSDNKEMGVSEAADNHTAERIHEEVEKTISLCANCHKKHHSNKSDVNISTMTPLNWPHPKEVADDA